MALRGILTFAVLVALFATPSACRSANIFQLAFSDNDACSTCKFAVRVLGDMLCDPYVDDTVVQWLDQVICSQVTDKAQCRDMVRGLAPAAVEWLRVNANPEAMCGSIDVCSAAPHALSSLKVLHHQQQQQLLHANRPNDMTCPLCMFVAAQVKQQMSDPAVQQSIRDASMAACAQLPAGMMQDACVSFVDEYEMTYFKYLADLEPVEVCMMIGTCMDGVLAKLQAQRKVPLLQLSPADLAPISQLKQAMQVAAAAGAPSNDHCETCKVVVMELRQLVANPELQAQLVDYAKQACAVFPSFQPTCEADVDQYAPMVFGMMLAYLQPEQVCIQLKMCPPPSLFDFFSMKAQLLGSKLASFSVITTTSSSSSSSDGSSSSDAPVVTTTLVTPLTLVEASPVENDVDDRTTSATSSSSSSSSSTKAKVHGPGLMLPMAS